MMTDNKTKRQPRISVIVNRSAGTHDGKTIGSEHLQDLFTSAGLHADITTMDPSGLKAAIKKSIQSGYDIICVGGGDGTLSTAAGLLAGSGATLAILPTGTLNNFAADIGIPTDLEAAVRLFLNGRRQKIDVAEMNGRVFLNNSSVGLYPKAVHLRERFLHRLGGRKWLAMTTAMLTVFKRFPLIKTTVHVGSEEHRFTTPFIFIGNNEYRLNLFDLGSRSAFTKGKLCVYTAKCRDRKGILRLIFKALFNSLHSDREFNRQFAERATLETAEAPVRVSMDGEVTRQTPPLHYRIRPKDLIVLTPPENAKT